MNMGDFMMDNNRDVLAPETWIHREGDAEPHFKDVWSHLKTAQGFITLQKSGLGQLPFNRSLQWNMQLK